MFYFEYVSPFALFPLQKLHHYYELIRPCALHWYSDPYGASAWISPLSSVRQVPTFRKKPKISSCHLYAGHHLSSNQITLKLIMEQLRGSIFDVIVHAFDTSSVVRLRSSPNLTPDRIFALPFPP